MLLPDMRETISFRENLPPSRRPQRFVSLRPARKIEEQRKAELEAAQNVAAKLQELAVELHLQASDDGHLFGSVTDRMIADAIASLGVTVPHQRIHLDSQIRSCGEYVVAVKLHQKVIVDVKVNVVRA